jgi:dolichol kinase
MWAASVGDPSATIAGRSWKAFTHSHGNGKTLIGAAACAVVSFAGAHYLAHFNLLPAAAIGLAAAIGESWPTRIDDNLRVACAAGAVGQLLS